MARFHQIPSSRDVTIPILLIPIPMVLVGIDIGRYSYWLSLVLAGIRIARYYYYYWYWYWYCYSYTYSSKVLIQSRSFHHPKHYKNAYLPPSLSFFHNSQKKSFLGLPMANITPHFYTKKALLSQDIDFQQTSITSFRGSKIRIKCRIFEILQKFLRDKTCKQGIILCKY